MKGFNADYFLTHEIVVLLNTQKYSFFPMAIITLTSDWGHKDHYAGSVKGAIYRFLPDARIIDVSHDIPSFDLNQAAFVVKHSYRDFPEGTIHIIAVNSEASIQTPHTLVFHNGHYFIGADNGIFSLIFDEQPSLIIELDIIQDSNYFTFPARDLFAKVASHVAAGKPLEELGPVRKKIVERISFRPVHLGNLIKGHVVYIDNYGNAFTNVSEEFFKSTVKNNKFLITFRSPNYKINSISTSYKDVSQGEMLAIFSTTGLLEIAIRDGKASSLLGLKPDQMIIIEIL
jgi:S-adenosylmethionine hydrolase